MYLEVLWLSEDVNGLVVLDGGHPPLFLAARLNHHRTIHINLKYNLFNFLLLHSVRDQLEKRFKILLQIRTKTFLKKKILFHNF